MSPRLRGRPRPLRGPARAAGLLLGVLSVSARAQPLPESAPGPALAVEWSGPGPELDCLGEEGLKRSVNDYLGRDAFEAPAELVLHVNVERLPDRHFRATLEVSDTSGRALGTREITSSTELCASLDERLVLAVALLADTGPEAPEPAPVSQPQARTPVVTGSDDQDETDELPTVPHEAPAGARRWSFAAEAAVVVEGGLLPAARPGLSLGLRIQPASWLLARAGAFAFLPASKELAGASVRFSLLGGMAELCAGELQARHFQRAICAGALYGGLGTATHGVAAGRAGTRAELGALFGLHAAEPLGRRWLLIVDGTVVFPDRPDRFLVQVNSEPRKLFQTSKPSVLASFGAAVTF